MPNRPKKTGKAAIPKSIEALAKTLHEYPVIKKLENAYGEQVAAKDNDSTECDISLTLSQKEFAVVLNALMERIAEQIIQIGAANKILGDMKAGNNGLVLPGGPIKP